MQARLWYSGDRRWKGYVGNRCTSGFWAIMRYVKNTSGSRFVCSSYHGISWRGACFYRSSSQVELVLSEARATGYSYLHFFKVEIETAVVISPHGSNFQLKTFSSIFQVATVSSWNPIRQNWAISYEFANVLFGQSLKYRLHFIIMIRDVKPSGYSCYASVLWGILGRSWIRICCRLISKPAWWRYMDYLSSESQKRHVERSCQFFVNGR